MQQFDGKVALVTGAGGGLGREYATTFARRGAQVIAVDVNEEGLNRTKDAIAHVDGDCVIKSCDLTDDAQVCQLFEELAKDLGGIDFLINNAGGDQAYSGPIEDFTTERWRLILNRNLDTAFLCAREASRLMKSRGFGKIVNVSSRAARSVGWYGTVTVAYVCAKAGILALTRCLAKELGPYNINVNCLVPSFTISRPAQQRTWDMMDAEERDRMLGMTPLRRLPELRELADVVAFLCSDESSYMTGVAIDVNGGSYMA